MEAIAIPAHYDGKHILLDRPFDLAPDMELAVVIKPRKIIEPDYWEKWLNCFEFTQDYIDIMEDYLEERKKMVFEERESFDV